MATRAPRPRGFGLAARGSADSLPGSLANNPLLSSWLAFRGEGFVQVYTGKVEIGQGLLTALALIAAEELCVEPDQIEVVVASTLRGPDEGVTSGSLSIQYSGSALRHACAAVRETVLQHAAARSGRPRDSLSIRAGQIFADVDECIGSYWDTALVGDLDSPAPAEVNARFLAV